MTVKTFNGKIKRVFFKKLDATDQYGNEFRSSLQLDDAEGTWVGFGGSKKDKFTIKEGKGYYDVQEGDTIFLKYEDSGKYKNAKKSDLTVIEKNANPSAKNASNSPKNNSKPQGNATTQGSSKEAQTGSNSTKTTNGSGGSTKTFKVYGTIKSIEEGVAVVVGEDSKEVQVVLGEHGSEVSVGGRLTAQVDDEGNIKSGFKSYGSPKANQKDDLPIRLGNAVTIANNFTDSYLDVVSIAKQVIGKVDELRAKMKVKYSGMDDYGLGSRCGQVAIIAAEKTKDINSFIEVAEELFIEICEAEQELREGKVGVEQKQETKQEVQESANIVIDDFSNYIDIPESEDFDEDNIPF